MADIKDYLAESGNLLNGEGEVKNVADILAAEPISNKKYDTRDFAVRSGIMLNGRGEPCDVVSALEKLAAGSGSEGGGDITELEAIVEALAQNKQDKTVVVSVTNSTINAEPDKIYIFNKENSISELNITLTNIKADTGNEFVIKFISAIEDMPISITDNNGGNDVLWHNEPKVLKGKAYTLAISIADGYKEAVLSYAEWV